MPKQYLGDPIPTANAERCDFLDPAVCLQPWPNDHFTIADPATDTGRRLNLQRASMPANNGRLTGTPVNVDPTDHNRADGFSPGNMIILKVPQVQTPAAFSNTGFVPVTNIRAYSDPNQPVVVINADTGERHPVFAELDANPVSDGTGGPAAVNLIVRPTRNFDEGARYIVALRNLRDAQNKPVEPPIPFRVYRDRLITEQAPVEARRAKIETLISRLQASGIPRSTLYMAWDFTVASETSLSERALTIRDDALARLGDTTPGDGVPQGDAPDFVIDSVEENPNANTLRRVNGRLTGVPCYLNQDGCAPGTQFSFDGDGDVTWNPAFDTEVPFRCIIPASVDGGAAVDPAKAATYGHGLLGAYTQVNGQERLANQQNSVWCAVDWAGFSGADLGVIIPDAQRRLAVQQVRGPDAAGLRQLPLPRPGDDQARRLQLERRIPVRRRLGTPAGDRHLEPLLRGDQPGRDHGRGADGDVAGLPSLGPERAWDELLDAPPAQRGQRRILQAREPRALRQLPERARAAAAALDDAAAMGPRRGQRLCAPHDRRPAGEHADPRRAAPARLRRPPGLERHGRDRGAHDRGERLHARARPGPPLGGQPVHGHPGDRLRRRPVHPVHGIGARLLRRRAVLLAQLGRHPRRCTRMLQFGPSHEPLPRLQPGADHERRPPRRGRLRQGPARLPAARGRRAAAHRGLPRPRGVRSPRARIRGP